MLQVMPQLLFSPPCAPAAQLRLSEVIAALSYALDITEGQPEGHAVRSCLIGLQIADLIELPAQLRPALYYALLLKDLGCSSNAARLCELFGADNLLNKRETKLVDWASLPQAVSFTLRNVAGSPLERAARLVGIALNGGTDAARQLFAVRCDRGAQITLMLGFPHQTAEAIRYLDEHWNGRGYPLGMRAETIPLLARILCLAQSIEIFWSTFGLESAHQMAQARSGSWFDPQLVAALGPLWAHDGFWQQLATADLHTIVTDHSPDDRILTADDTMLDRLAEAFAQVIDAKSPWTYRHSNGVMEKAIGIANRILDKPGQLSDLEMSEVRRHPLYTRRILERVASFRDLAYVASLHHERLDGSGYPYGIGAPELPQIARILAVADVCDALCAARPYRAAMPWPAALQILEREAGSGLCAESVAAVRIFLAAGPG